MTLDLRDLRAACFEAAEGAKFERKPQPVEDIQALADKFYEIAAEIAKLIHEVDKDSQIVNRAVWYLSQVHAVPPMKNDVRWFHEMLEALVELALPNTYVGAGKPQAFLQDLLKGITWSIDNPFDYEQN